MTAAPERPCKAYLGPTCASEGPERPWWPTPRHGAVGRRRRPAWRPVCPLSYLGCGPRPGRMGSEKRAEAKTAKEPSALQQRYKALRRRQLSRTAKAPQLSRPRPPV
eukprot:scaffold334_cov356-Prasinococcus_capsulatus_cf.AAC.2